MSVLISGAGIAGPTLAYWLSVYGIESTLVERAPALRSGGYAIDFWGLGFDIAERMGLLPDLRRDGYNIQELRIVNARGERVSGFNVDIIRRAARGRYVTIPRSDLSRNIYRQVEGRCETIFGDSITGIEQDPDGVTVNFQHASTRRFDIVVGADGLHSGVRRLAFGEEEKFEKFLGYSVAAFETTGYPHRDVDIYVNYSMPGRQVGRLSLRDDRTLFLFVFADEQGGLSDTDQPESHKAALRARFEGLGWECAQILDAMDAAPDLYYDRVSQIRMSRWSRGRVGLIGDAAACPSLLAGQGSALAMIAAYVLAGELSRHSPEEALRRYEALLHRFLLAKQKAAEGFAASFTPKTRWGLFLRNQILKAFALPFVARLAVGGSLLDRIELPDYSAK